MSRLIHREYEDALVFTGQLHACIDPAALRRLIVRGLSGMIGADRVTFEHFAPTVPQIWAVAEPNEPYLPWMWDTFLSHLHEHPAIMHYRETGDTAAVKISDFISVREWHRTGLYQNLHRKLGIEDQMGICLGPPHREFYSVVLARSDRSFSERDRTILNLLRPHIAQAHANSRVLDRLRRNCRKQSEAANWLTQTAILLDEHGSVRHCPARARQLFRQYFGQTFRRNQLPVELGEWMRGQLSVQQGDGASQNNATAFVRNRGGGRAVFRLQSKNGAGFVIIAEEQSVHSPEAIGSLGLTRQQIRVLVEVEKGKTNTEIASTLFLSPHTVRTHLDNIFDALNVTNRTAAVARLRGIA